MRPPSVPRRLLARLLPPSDRRIILDDLDEEFARHGQAWYWLQVVTSVPGALRLRWRAAGRPGFGQRRALRLLDDVSRDAHFAWRTWRRQPLFAAAAILTQALGIGVSAAVAAMAYDTLVRPLPYAEPSRLVHLFEGAGEGGFSFLDFMHLRLSTRTLSAVVAYSGGSRTLVRPGADPERVPMAEVSDGFFEALGVAPALGRTFLPAETRREAPPVVMLAHGAWVRRFDADPSIVGRTISLDGQSALVVGVLPAGFEFPLRGLAELWLPLRPSRAQEERGYYHWMDVIGRLAPSATPDQVTADLAVIAAARAADDPKWHATVRYRAVALHDLVVGEIRPALLVLIGAVALLLATACANIAGLLLTRSAGRARELSVRAAIGAGTGRLVRQLITESLLLALAGGVLGAALSRWLLQAAVAALPPRQRAVLPHIDQLGVTPGLVLFALGLSVATGVLFSLLPALRWSRHDLARPLRGTRTTTSGPQRRTQAALVAAEIALAFVLLSGAGLLARSVHRLLGVSPGFDMRGLLTMRVSLPGARYAAAAQVLAFYDRLAGRLAAMPAVSGVAASTQLPLQGRGNSGVPAIEGRATVAGGGPEVSIRTISANYFDVVGLRLEGGRAFTDADRDGSPRAVVVNHTFAQRVLDGASPLGQRLRFAFLGTDPFEIVGIVGDEQVEELDRPRTPIVYFAMTQDPSNAFSVVIRADHPVEAAAAARQVMAGIDPALPLYAVATMEQVMERSGAVYFRRVMLALLAVFAAAAVLLASIAIYSLLAQSVSERTREIGVRLALGATRRDVMRLMVASGIAPAGIGMAVGVIGSLATGRALGSLLFDVGPADPLALVGAGALVGAVAISACVLPTWRAVRVDPASTLRHE